MIKFSVQFYEYNSDKPIFLPPPVKQGDVVEAVEFNQTTQLYDILITRPTIDFKRPLQAPRKPAGAFK